MKVSTERIPESQVVLQIEVDDVRLEKALESSYRRIASKTRVPGFRPGKAPRDVLERHVGPEAVLHDAIDRLLPDVYKEALEEESIEPIDQAKYELVTERPLVAKFTIPVQPKVELGDYASLRVPREPVVVEPERVQEGLEALRRRYATLEPADRPVEWSDVLRADVHGTVDDTVIAHDEDVEFQLLEDRPIGLPGFTEGLIGREKGAEFEFEAAVPEDAADEQLRGKQARYRVLIKEVKREILPELDDEFARQAGEGFSNLQALRSRLEEDLRHALEDEAEHRYHDSILKALVEQSELEFPPVMVEREVERLLRQQSGAAGAPGGQSRPDDLERYLQQLGKSEEEVREELRPMAETRVRRSLVLSELETAEDIQVTDDEVDTEISRLTSGAGNQADEVQRLFSSNGAKESLRESLITRKTLERLTQIASVAEAEPKEAQANESKDG